MISLGPGRALAVGPAVTTFQSSAGPVTLEQVLTFVLEKKQGKWVIIHDHTSTKPHSG